MYKYKLTGLSAVLLSALSVSPALAQSKNWTGGYAGVHGGASRSGYETQLDNASRFCYTESEATGTGQVLENGCTFDSNQVTATSRVKDSASTSEGSGSGHVDMGSSNITSSAFSSGPGGASGSGSASYDDPDQGVVSSSGSFTYNGSSASAMALGALNIFNMSTGGEQSVTGGSFGGHIGYNYQTSNNIVFGAEADISVLANNAFTVNDVSENSNYAKTYSRSISAEADFVTSARLRLGYAYGDFLPYLTGGLAYSRLNVDVSSSFKDYSNDIGSSQSFSKGVFGSVVGGGISWQVKDGIVLSGEGLYYKFNKGIDISDATLNEAATDTVKLDDVMEWRLKLSMELN
ncbi:MAG: outer membrane protein [Methyloligellaceae bacterium]